MLRRGCVDGDVPGRRCWSPYYAVVVVVMLRLDGVMADGLMVVVVRCAGGGRRRGGRGQKLRLLGWWVLGLHGDCPARHLNRIMARGAVSLVLARRVPSRTVQ